MVAQLFDRLGDFDKAIHLTDRQKREILNHKRDKKTNAIKWPEDELAAPPAATLEEELKAADQLAEILAAVNPTVSGEAEEAERKKIAEELKAGLRAKYAAKEGK